MAEKSGWEWAIKAGTIIAGMFSGNVKNWGQIILELINAVKGFLQFFKDRAEQDRRETFNEGAKESDTKKMEEGFNSPIAGKPSGHDTDIFDD